MWRADASITAGVYNTQPQSAVRTVSAALWDSTAAPKEMILRATYESILALRIALKFQHFLWAGCG